MSKKCRAYSESKLGLEPPDNRKAFYAGWDAALRAALAKCNYPNCVDNGPDGKCTRWLLGECEKSEDFRGER